MFSKAAQLVVLIRGCILTPKSRLAKFYMAGCQRISSKSWPHALI